jgi:cytochrome c553
MLKKTMLIVIMLLFTTNLWAAKTMNVSAGVHNLGSGGIFQGKAGNEDEVCIFCHTPHGGSLAAPLWNRNLPTATGFSHYTSATLSPYMKGLSTTRNINTESLLCMSCHDGVIGMNSILNNSNRTGAPPDNGQSMFDPSFGLGVSPVIGEAGQSLTNDHPISFSYYDASRVANNPKLHPADGGADDPRKDGINGVRFFGLGATVGGQRVECSSCHDPHVDYSATGDPLYAPFLVMPNTGSALCLACHIK